LDREIEITHCAEGNVSSELREEKGVISWGEDCGEHVPKEDPAGGQILLGV